MCNIIVLPAFSVQKEKENMSMKYIPLANLKNTAGIVAFCKEANEVVVANRNGEPKLVLMSREVYENGLGKVTEDVCNNVKRDIELVAEPVLIRTFNNPAEMVRICEIVSGQIVPVLRNGVDELYVMDYESYRMRKAYLVELLKSTIH